MGLVITATAQEWMQKIRKRFGFPYVSIRYTHGGGGEIRGGAVEYSSSLVVPFSSEKMMEGLLLQLANEPGDLEPRVSYYTSELGNYVNSYIVTVKVSGYEIPYVLLRSLEDARAVKDRIAPQYKPDIVLTRLYLSVHDGDGEIPVSLDL